jgi:hypothetical protein
MESCSKTYIRFIPKEWDLPGNSHGTGWSGSNRTVVFELNLGARKPSFNVVSGLAPDVWIDPLWQRAQSAPFSHRRKRNDRPRDWVSLHHAGKSKLLVGDEIPDDVDDIPGEVVKWCVARLNAEETRQVIAIIAGEFPRLDELYRTRASA